MSPLRRAAVGKFAPVSLEEQRDLLERHGRRLPKHLQIPGEWLDFEGLMNHIFLPENGCFQSLHIQQFSSGATQQLASMLLDGGANPSLPLPWSWTGTKESMMYEPGAHIIDLSIQVEESRSVDAIRSGFLPPYRSLGGKWGALAGSEALLAITLQSFEIQNLLRDLDVHAIVVAGINLEDRATVGPGLVPMISWDGHSGQRQQMEAVWSHEILRRCAVPVVRYSHSVQELKRKKVS